MNQEILSLDSELEGDGAETASPGQGAVYRDPGRGPGTRLPRETPGRGHTQRGMSNLPGGSGDPSAG